jgi:hypothetical protein
MKRRFILYRRKLGGTFYVEDTQTRKQESLGTKNRAKAKTGTFTNSAGILAVHKPTLPT